MKVIIAGTTEFNDYKFLKEKVIAVFRELGITKRSQVEIVSGCAKGADTLGERFADEYNIKVKPFPADWAVYGRPAGMIRNAEMAEYAKGDGVLIAFWMDRSPGTKNMIENAKKRGLKTFIFEIS